LTEAWFGLRASDIVKRAVYYGVTRRAMSGGMRVASDENGGPGKGEPGTSLP